MTSRVIATLGLLVALGIIFGYVLPTWNGSIADTSTAIANDNAALAAASEYDARQNQLASQRNAIDPSSLSRLAAFLPDSVDNVRIILDLDSLAARSGLSLSSIDVAQNSTPSAAAGTPTTASPAAPSGAPGIMVSRTGTIGSVDLSLSAVGTYAAMQTFLKGIEESQRLLDVRELDIKGSDTGVYAYDMKVRLYWLQ